MQKTLLTLSAALLCAAVVFAQTGSRLVARSIYGNHPVPTTTWRLLDSTHMNYSPLRGYEAAIGEWQFDSDSTIGYVGMAQPTYEVVGRTTQTFTPDGHIATQMHTSADGLGNWIDNEWHKYNWNTDGTVATHTQANLQTAPHWDSSRTTYTYNSAKQVTLEFVEVRWASYPWKNGSKQFTTYNGSGKPISWLSVIWDGVSQYDSATRFIYNYNGAGQLVQQFIQSYSGGGWVTDQDHNFTYDNNGNLIQHETLDLMNSSAVKLDYIYDVHNDRISEEQSDKGGVVINYEKTRRNEYTYNSLHQLTKMDLFYWDNTTSQFSSLINTEYYYYELYPTSVEDVMQTAAAIRIFPVPASNYVQVQLSSQQPTDIILFDMSGKPVKYAAIAGGTANSRIDISNLPAGMYTLHAMVNGQSTVQRISVVK